MKWSMNENSPCFNSGELKNCIKKAESILIDNGIDPDEAETVLQALGYAFDIELYPDEDPAPVGKFKVGQTYEWVCWFSGGTTEYEVKSVDNGTVTLVAIKHEYDGVHKTEETYPIETDENGNERILMAEYAGHKGYIYAK